MMRSTILLGALALVGCGNGGNQTFKVGGQTLTVRDQGYFYTDNADYCPKGGLGQMLLDFVDFNFICDPTHSPQKDPESPHVELRIILTTGMAPDFAVHPNMGLPYDSTTMPDCQNGPGDLIIGEWLHYPNGHDGTAPDSTRYATSAHLLFTQFDKTKAKPLQGNFDLKFGADEVKSNFTIYNCN